MVDRPNGPLSSPSVVAVLRSVSLGVEHGYLDPSPHNEAGAAYFVCGQPGAPEQSVLVMVRAART
jgi:AP-2 complex subunit alpha